MWVSSAHLPSPSHGVPALSWGLWDFLSPGAAASDLKLPLPVVPPRLPQSGSTSPRRWLPRLSPPPSPMPQGKRSTVPSGALASGLASPSTVNALPPPAPSVKILGAHRDRSPGRLWVPLLTMVRGHHFSRTGAKADSICLIC